MFRKKKLQLQISNGIDRDYWGKLIFRTRRALASVPRNDGRVLKVDIRSRTYELIAQKAV